jgi:AAA+ superfamily predicted ATPase
MANSELLFLLRSLSRCVYFVTDEEDRFLVKLRDSLKQYSDRTWVFNAAFGLVPLNQLIKDWSTRAHAENADTQGIHEAMIKVYKDDPKEQQNFYIFTDPERWLTDPHVVRRVLNILHQLHQDIRTIKILIFVGTRKVVPDKLSRYMEVVYDRGLTPEEIRDVVGDAAKHLDVEYPPNAEQMFKGLTSYEVNRAVSQSIVKTKKSPEGKRIDPKIVVDFRRHQLRKTDLVQYVDTDEFPFSVVGGADRFKSWANKTKASWTERGQKFGLKPPKGVLAVGVWGCGKSLSVKAMGNAWDLPVVQLEMGRLRSSGVGDSESNVYRVIRIIEAAAPCVVWVDEAEKSLSGGASSAQSDAGTTSRTIGILSTWLQETTAQVCLAMTANGLKNLPIEFINRMDERFFFDMPTEEDRVDIIKIHIAKAGQNPDNYDLASLSEKAKGMVGREIEQAIGSAMIESFAQNKSGLDEEILSNELASKPRILRTMVDEVKELTDWVGWDPDAKEGIRARFASNPGKVVRDLKLG